MRFIKKHASVSILCLTLFFIQCTAAQEDFGNQFDEVLTTVEDNFYNPNKIAEMSERFRRHYRIKAVKSANNSEFSAVVNAMLSELNTSHTYYLTPDHIEYYQLASLFSRIPKIGALFPDGRVEYPSIGILPLEMDGRCFVASVLSGSEAERAGLLQGDEIITANNKPFSLIRSFRDSVDRPIPLDIRRLQGKELLTISVTPKLVNPNEEFLQAQKASTRVIEQDGYKIGYMHIWSYAGRQFHTALEEAVAWGDLRDADALIVDLRFGLGGASPSYLNLFNQDTPKLVFTDREGKKTIFDAQWRKPAAYLVNGFSRSGKELLAFGAAQFENLMVTGEPTAGDVVSGRLYPMNNGDLLYLAVNDVQVNGQRLEGVGVEPDISIPMTIPRSAGEDIQLTGTLSALIKAVQSSK